MYQVKNLINGVRATQKDLSTDGSQFLDYLKGQQRMAFDWLYDPVDRCIRCIIWATAAQIMASMKYSDVVLQDCTFGTNQFGILLCLFIGVDCNMRYAVLEREDTAGMIWAFEWFIHNCCPPGVHPVTWLTDGCAAAAAAIMKVCPSSHHFLCSWHLWKNIKHTDQRMRGESLLRDAIKTAFRKAEYSLSEASFRAAWGSLEKLLDVPAVPDQLRRYFARLYTDRGRWAFCYRSRAFTLSLSATSRVEGTFAALKRLLRGTVRGLSWLGQHLTALSLEKALKELYEAAKGRWGHLGSLPGWLPSHFPDVLGFVDTRGSVWLQSFIRGEMSRAPAYKVTPINATSSLGVAAAGAVACLVGLPPAGATAIGSVPTSAGGDTGFIAMSTANDAAAAEATEAAAAAAAADSAATFNAADVAAGDPDNSADTETDGTLPPDDRARLDPNDVLLAFTGMPSIVAQFKVEPRTAGGAKSCNVVVCMSDGTHLCSCTLVVRQGVPCRHFFACRIDSGLEKTPFAPSIINVRYLDDRFRGGRDSNGATTQAASDAASSVSTSRTGGSTGGSVGGTAAGDVEAASAVASTAAAATSAVASAADADAAAGWDNFVSSVAALVLGAPHPPPSLLDTWLW
ncbi:unnamed protein product [Phaeothamnion confervicola]